MANIQPKADYLFEASWEACNKVGGIYTVLKSKAAQTVERYGDKYYLVGPYFPAAARGEFQEETPEGAFKEVFDELAKEGIVCHIGTWLIEGEPRVILVDFSKYWYAGNDIKRLLWEWYGVDSLDAPRDFEEPIIWSFAVGRLIELLHQHLDGNGVSIVAQFHEWLAGAGLLYLEHQKASIGTVFTTHATILGRTLAGSNVPLYDMLDTINPDEAARKYGVIAKHTVEKNAAQKANIFTTVSRVTAIEAQHFLGREADIILPNGLDMGKFPTLEEVAIQHRIQGKRIRSFIQRYFFPYYSFDLTRTLIYFTVGRYEFHNKGIDIYIKALGELNKRLKLEKEEQTIVAFIWVPSDAQGIREDVMTAQNTYKDIVDLYEEVSEDVKDSILNALITDGPFSKDSVFHDTPDFLREMKRKTMRFHRDGVPPLTTHTLAYPNDSVVNACTEAGLGNRKGDRVKIVFFPTYLTGNDGLLDLNYYESIQSADFGVFPSFYEPWGYTPLEGAALGVPSVTTDLAGFGKFLLEKEEPREFPGVYVLERFHRPDHEIVQSLSDILFRFSQFIPNDRAKDKIRAREIAAEADWSIFINNYIEAHNKALL